MSDSINAPIFAGRYRFEPVGDDWDKGRSGYTHLVYDLKTKRRGVIKRAEINLEQAVQRLKNEVNALRALQGMGVPEVYDTGTTTYGSKKYFYMVLEYIEGMRVEGNLSSLSITNRVEILKKLFGLLAQSHGKGIVNGDVDLKHLFWEANKRQLIVIDWDNAKLGVDPNKKTEFAYDLARAGEIIFSLVTRKGQPPARGSLALPDDSALIPDLVPVPTEIRRLCEWAPRTPTENTWAPHTSLELFRASERWLKSISPSESFTSFYAKPKPSKTKPCAIWSLVIAGIVLASVVAASLMFPDIIDSLLGTATDTMTETAIPSIVATETLSPSQTPSPSIPPTEITEEPTEEPVSTPVIILEPTEEPVATPVIIPSPRVYEYTDEAFKNTRHEDEDRILVFNETVSFSSNLEECWRKALNPSNIQEREGFFRNDHKVDKWWIFALVEEQAVEASFHLCLDQPVMAMGLNSLVTHLEPQKQGVGGGEFGFFLEGQTDDGSGYRREYVFWINSNDDNGNNGELHLKVREDNNVLQDYYDEIKEITSLERNGTSQGQGYHYSFPIQIFLEINNQEMDILYLQRAPETTVERIDPGEMKRIDSAIRPTSGDVQKIGLIGRGGEMLVRIWPLVLFEW